MPSHSGPPLDTVSGPDEGPDAPLERVRRNLRLAKACRRALLRATDERDLLHTVCHTLVLEGGYRFVWVGMADHQSRLVVPVAQAGESDGYLAAVRIRWDDSPEGRGPTGSAVRTGQSYWTRDVATDPRMAPWRAPLLARGFHSSIALPMTLGEEILGAVTVYAGTTDAFNPEEVALLEELAADLAFGIDTLRTRFAHRRMALAVEQSPAVVVVTDLTGAIEYVNTRFTELTGYRLADVKGLDARAIASAGASPEDHAQLWATVTQGARWSGDLHQRRKDGSTYTEAATVLPMHDTAGHPTGYLRVGEDVSQLQALEQQLLHAQKMEAVGRLAGGVAHDFNNLLTVMHGFTELARLGLDEAHPARADLGQVLDACSRAANLTRQLLAFSRHAVFQPEALDACAVIRDAGPMLRCLVGEDIEVSVDVAAPSCRVLVEPGAIEQIVMNLAVNARDAMPDGGSLRVVVSQVTPPGSPDVSAGDGERHFVQIEVRDSGHGMDAATRARIFEPFFTTKPAGRGTGLGLSTVYGIVTRAGGFIQVDSAPGAGTCFRIGFPLAEGTAEPLVAVPEGPVAVGRTGTVLVVDDDEGIREYTSRTLRRAGFDVLVASSPGEALLVSEKHPGPVDVLLTDVVMPHMAGPELSGRLAAVRPDLLTLYMSGYTDDVLLGKDVAGGDVQLIRKPFGGEALVRRVRDVLDARAAGG